ncbi:MAG: beta-lactamase family protein [Acidimicrobiaceae bacterium]|nr:beta-lactamase family protein [Acidimicrobiaceae bacterium]
MVPVDIANLAEGFPGEWAIAYGSIGEGGITRLKELGSKGLFPLASVSKLFTALAAHVAIEEGTLDAKEPVLANSASVYDLLSHASGLPFAFPRPGDFAFEGITSESRPASRRIYSNVGYELLADLIGRNSEMSFRNYLFEAVAEPLGANGLELDPGLYDASGPTGAAAGIVASISDLVALVNGFVSPGILSLDTLRLIRDPHHPELDGMLPGFGFMRPCPWGLGPELKGEKAPHWTGGRNSKGTFGHFGQSGASFWIDLENRCFLATLSSVAFGDWAKDLWPSLSDAVVEEANS